MNIRIFYDGANLEQIRTLLFGGTIQGVTTNPSLMRKEGVRDYESSAREIVAACSNLPVSFEICADDQEEIIRQAKIIAGWGESVYVKIPIIRTDGSENTDIIHHLSVEGIKINVTAIMTSDQAHSAIAAVSSETPSIISIFAGRIADTGRDPTPTLRQAVAWAREKHPVQVLWASTREIFNIIQAETAGCHIITVPPDVLKKIPLLGKDLTAVTLDTVQTFYQDAQESGLSC